MAEQEQVRIAVIDFTKCHPEKCNYLCKRMCPLNRTGKECITIASDGKPRISEQLCTACRICVHKCPFNAISIVNLTAKFINRVHCYGENKFRLYGLPVPMQSKVIGLIGRNGIGKSTALKILAGKIVPRPDCKGEEGYEAIVELFKGKELQAYFEKLSKQGIKVSYKPQEINKIAEAFKGRVEQLLKQFDELGKLNEIIEELNLSDILKSSVSRISGGELQRVAIACCILRDAELYFFDEPSSYLDVQERLRIAKIIRELAEKEKYVVVAEHDLAVLDYLSDFVHVLFGSKGVYGVVSSRLSVLNGINQYLEGYLKNENIRFREKELVFSRIAEKPEKNASYLAYPAFTKSYENFKLEALAGTIMKSEVLGILGPNAIGKTTFVKTLAGIIDSDDGKLNLGLKLAFKPQYLRPEEGITVEELIMQSSLDRELFEKEANKRFAISELYERNLEELSGGELQKVSLAITMCKEADLYLLDEPSAFLDVEERLNAAEFIKSVIEKKEKACIVVDHDLLFQDYLCDRLIVFEGIPAKHGKALEPQNKELAMNRFLASLDITFRRDPQTGRPRANKLGSVKDHEQKKQGKYYYL
ncbi:MAG: ribosome biogenesis/translation initiation ATPase RLI [Candidatus Diapherotrites archaeon]|nr:ribosome biogenesis/translation initiation ATPase RLI [Candidatus Diapherotrites archaeon]